MKLLKTEITPITNEPLYVDARQQPFLWSPFHSQPSFHSHPEMELTFIEEGFGKRIIGDTIEPFEDGDMVLIGPNVPHMWLSDPTFYKPGSTLRSKAIVTYFDSSIFIPFFNALKEFDEIKMTIREAAKGIRIFGDTRNIIANRLAQLATATGFRKVNGLLEIIHLISSSVEKHFILDNQTHIGNNIQRDKFVEVIHYIKTNLDRPIYLHEVAEIACLTEPSFSRLFKQRMKKTFSAFHAELRIARAKELLLAGRLSVKEVAYHCGYNSLAYFHMLFKKQVGMCPLQFKTAIDSGSTQTVHTS